MISINDICAWTGGKAEGLSGGADITISSFSTDTRTILSGALFVALKGENSDGQAFVKDAESKGAVACLVQEVVAGITISQIVVPDTLKALQEIAAAYRQKLNIPIIAITGSNGKTTTKNYIAAILGKKYKVAYTKASFNNHIGLPLSILSVKPDDEIAVMEIGTNHPGEIKGLCDICKPTAGVITNIGVAHIENFVSKAAIAQEKSQLAKCLPDAAGGGFMVIPAEYEFADTFRGVTKAKIIEMSRSAEPYTSLAVEIRKVGIQAEHLLTDALLAAAIGKKLGISDAEIIDALANAKGEDGRFTLKQVETKNVAGQIEQLEIIDDTYNANPDSVCAAIEAMAKLYPERRKIIALGKLMEQGDFLNEGYARIIKDAKATRFEIVIFVDIPYESAEILHVKNQKECAEIIKNTHKIGDIVLLKGSKSAEMKKVIGFLS